MENNQLSVFGGHHGSSSQVSGDSSLNPQKLIEFLIEEDDTSLSEDDASLSESVEEYEIVNKEDQLEAEGVDALEANNENEKRDELCIGMEFSSDETAHKAYCKYAGNYGFNSSGRYKIVSFEPNHNHDLVRTPMKHLLKGNRAVTVSQKQHADDAEMSGISAKATVEMMSMEIPKEAVKQSIGKRYSHIFRTFREIASVAAEHIELTSCVDEDAIELLKKLEEKKKELVRANKWMPHSSEDKLVEEEEEDEDIPNVRGIKRKNPVGRPKNQHNGLHGRWKGVLEKKKHGDSSLIPQKLIEFLVDEDDTSLSDSESEEEYEIVNKEDQLETEGVDALEANNENERRDELCIGMEFSSDETAHKAYCKYADSHGFNVRKQRRTKRNKEDEDEKVARILYVCSKEGVRKESKFKRSYTRPITRCGCKAHMACYLHSSEEVYTPEVFTLFQKEYTVIGDYVAKKTSKSEMVYEYNVSYRGVAREHLVKYDAANLTIHCSCMKFSFAGFLCRHALKVLDKKNVRRIPSTYILNRWSKEAKARTISYYHSEIPKEAVKESIGKRYSYICRTFREIASVAAEHIELTSCVDEDAIELLKKLEEKKKDLVRANKWMLHSSEDKLVEEDEDVPNVRGIKRKNPVGRPKNQQNGLHGRFKGVLEKKKRGTSKSSSKARVKKMLSFQESTPIPDTQSTDPILHNEPLISQVPQSIVAVTNPTLPSGSFFTQLLQLLSCYSCLLLFFYVTLTSIGSKTGDSSLIPQKLIEFLVDEDDTSLSDSESEEEYEIVNKEDQLETEGVDALEANNENERRDELCFGMEFSSDETAHKAYCKYAGSHGFNVRKQRRTKKNKEDEKVARILYVCSKEGVRKESKFKRSYTRPITRCGCKAHMACYLQSSGREIAVTVSQKQHADDAEMSGISAKATVEMMSMEVGGRENLEEVYTPEVFTLFQKEYTVIGDYVAKKDQTYRTSVAAEHIELTSCVDEDAIELLKKLEEKKKELVRANKWMPHSSEDKLVEEEEEDEDVLNVRGIKKKNHVGRPKNQQDGLHGRFKGVLEKKKRGTSKSSSKARVKKMLSFQESTPIPDTQSTDPILHNEPLISQVLQGFWTSPPWDITSLTNVYIVVTLSCFYSLRFACVSTMTQATTHSLYPLTFGLFL
ncbi:hypothetical protein DY000_02047089 [Brassica cretica]|uniref:SWIM-type domain-containing protein n=1 Tax=Brassica cretica TaxID=69181 RepID=A0ABQ7F6K4_BRACR|nr:hypothetical protein DY000_02047089 [Brassica cretica]